MHFVVLVGEKQRKVKRRQSKLHCANFLALLDMSKTEKTYWTVEVKSSDTVRLLTFRQTAFEALAV